MAIGILVVVWLLLCIELPGIRLMINGLVPNLHDGQREGGDAILILSVFFL